MGSLILGAGRRTVLALVVGSLVLGLVAVPTVSASASQSNGAGFCKSDWNQSQDRWQEARLSFCTSLVGHAVVVTSSVGGAHYYWGGRWYANKYPTNVRYKLFVDHIDRGGVTTKVKEDIWHSGTSGVLADNWIKNFAILERGTYRVTLIVDVTGMYWTGHDSSVRLVMGADLHHDGPQPSA